ncbi:progranulin-like [Myxocyprinus asiaticus]|uniref:progranulin-like n=1 Tax=Myxocyprinus asiaticus TaxID=70543 RepID=UPI002223956A|nr:progranulin-like [Myxocyprinus asiaticus]
MLRTVVVALLCVFLNECSALICPDGGMCEDGNTCCQMPSGGYGCCPLPNAECCSDHLHCCFEGTLCDLEHSKCVNKTHVLDWVERVAITQQAVVCPDQVSECRNDTTCCQMPDGSWGCCPMKNAVCCEDHLHCCPHDTVCNLAASTCDRASYHGPRFSVPLLRKITAVTLPSQNQNCDDTSLCPTGATCCKQNTGACCPLPQAVCCDDQEHCCPQNYKCDLTHKTCVRPGFPSMPWLKKQPVLSVTQQSELNAVSPALAGPVHRHMCDDHTSCPGDDTCCYMNKLSKWGCCPLPKAVCCEDSGHCCPSGYKCNEKKTSCTKAYHEIPWYRKQEARITERSGVSSGVKDVKCDSTTSCASGSTCCKLPTGEWGCCPLVEAVCCNDHEHCCPQGYTCNLEFGTCIKPSDVHTIPLIQIHRQFKMQSEEVVCDATTRCSIAQTCCRISDSTWACCPYKEAVCCNDMKHCCPMGYKCDPKVKGCTKESSLTWWENSL